MSSTLAYPEVLDTEPPAAQVPMAVRGFDPTLARPFIYKSVSEETRSASHRAILEFFQFVGNVHPTQVSPE